jgi:hypothetical protein
MAIRTPLILISGAFSQLPSGDVVPGFDSIALASGNAALVVAGSALSSGTTALASGNAALVLASTALASGNAALAKPSTGGPATTDTLLLL